MRIFEGRIVQTDPRSSRQDRTQKCKPPRDPQGLSDDAESEYKKSIASDRCAHTQRTAVRSSSRRVTMIDAGVRTPLRAGSFRC